MPTPTALAQRLLVWQTFRETVWGTPGAATAKWMGVKPYPSLTPKRKATIFDQARGSLAPGFNSAILEKGGVVKIGGFLTYQDAIFLGHAIWGIVTPTGAGPYTYTYVGPTTTQMNLQTYTVEYSQASSLARAQGTVFQKLSIKGEAAKEISWEMSGWAQDIDPAWSGSLAALSDRTVEPVLMPSTALAMDATGGTIGTTAFANTMISFGLEIENSAKPILTAGSLTPANWVIGDKWQASLSLGLLYTSAVRTYINNTLQAGTVALIQVKPTSGTNTITWNFAGVLADDIELYGEKEGAQIVNVKLDGIYDSGAALHTGMIVVNPVTTIP